MFEESPDIVVPPRVRNLNGLSAPDSANILRELLGTRHGGAVDENRYDMEVSRQGRRDLFAMKIVRIVEAWVRRPPGSDDDDHSERPLQLPPNEVWKVDARRQSLDVLEDLT